MTEEMNQTTKGQLLEQQSAEERRAFAAFRTSYMQRVAAPQRPPKMNLRNLGFQFYLYFVQSIASIALAAMRTWEAFFRVGMLAGHGSNYALLEAWLAVIVVEVGMVTYAASNAHKSYHKAEAAARAKAEAEGKQYRRNRSVDANSFLISGGLVLLGFLSAGAGLDQAVRAIKDVDPNFLTFLSYTLNILIGLGVSVIAFIGGEILGQQLAIVTADYEELASEYDDAVAAYEDEIIRAWNISDERRIIRAEVRSAAKMSASASSAEFGYGSVTNNFRTSPNNGGELRRPPKQTERVFQYMDQIFQTEQRVPSFSEVMEVLGIAKATASEARTKWLHDRGVAAEED